MNKNDITIKVHTLGNKDLANKFQEIANQVSLKTAKVIRDEFGRALTAGLTFEEQASHCLYVLMDLDSIIKELEK